MPSETAIKTRQKKIMAQVRAARVDGLLTADPANVSYLTGFQGHDAWALLIGRRLWLLTDSRYTEQARHECAGCTIIERKKSLAEETARIVSRQKTPPVLGLDVKISLALQQTIRKQVKTRFKPVSGLVETVRSVKDPDEIRTIRRAVKINRAALDAALRQLRVGMTENELAGILELEIRKRGGHIGFETIVCFGPNGSRNHHSPGSRKLHKTDTILIDYGTSVDNYRCDMTRCFGVNRVTREYAHAYHTVAAAHQAAIRAVIAGAPLEQVDQAARRVIAESPFPVYGHGTGHGIGLDIHEQPFIGRSRGTTLQDGQVITIEPGIYLPGKWGIRIEDDILVTSAGPRMLTTDTLPAPLTILTVE